MKSSLKATRFCENFKKRINRKLALSLAACAHCGMCTDSCHYYIATGDPKLTPAYKADRIRRLYRRQFTWFGRLFPWWVSAENVWKDEQLEGLKEVFFGSCTACRRCTINCPLGIDMAALVSFTRSLLIDEGMAPPGIAAVMHDQWTTGNQMAVSDQDYLETVAWLEDELRQETGDLSARIPLDQKGSDFLYVVNPREIKYAPNSLLAAARIFHESGLSWTMGSKGWDNTNFGLFSGKADLGRHMCKRTYGQAEELGVKMLVVSECGHGFRSLKYEARNWGISQRQPFEIISVLQLVADLITQNRIKLEPRRNDRPVTYHDPCNLSRFCGLIEEPRLCLRHACLDFREMIPNQIDSLCCTGGGGAMSMSEYSPLRLRVTKLKAKQIASTGASIVVTACHNCADGLASVIKANHLKFKMANGEERPVNVCTICELVANAMVRRNFRN